MSRKREYKKPGPETALTPELFKLIREATLKGLNLAETAKFAQINEGTFYVWHSDNRLNLADKVKSWRLDRKLILAEGNIEEILQMDIINKGVTKDGKEVFEFDDVGKLRVKADMSKFVAQTLGRSDYAVRQEVTGANGEELKVDITNTKIMEVINEMDNKLKEAMSNVQKNKEDN